LLGSDLYRRGQVELIGAELALAASSEGTDTLEAYRNSTIALIVRASR
jgi:hypothetical protein